MAAIYPKKTAPFNSTEKRAKPKKQLTNVPGKWSYYVLCLLAAKRNLDMFVILYTIGGLLLSISSYLTAALHLLLIMLV